MSEIKTLGNGHKVINDDAFMLPNEHGESIKMTYVLTADQFGMRAVYIGVGSPEFVARRGMKQRFEAAKTYFSGLKEEEYRH